MVIVKLIPIFILYMTPISLQFKYISTIIKEFNLKSPYLVGSIKEFPLDFIKSLYNQDNFVVVHSKLEDIKFEEKIVTNVIAFLNSNDTKIALDSIPKNPDNKFMLTSKSDKIEEFLNTVAAKTKIDQKVFIFTNDTQEIYETYTINNFIVKKKLGYVDSISNNFKWNGNVNPNFIKRRSDLHGIILKGMVEFSGLNMNANSSYRQMAPYFPNNQTYQVNDFTYGLFHDILEILQDGLNFTTILYKHKNVNWGSVRPQPNGSFEGTGIVGDLFFKRADIVVASLHNRIDRALFIDFLPPCQIFNAELYIPNSNRESIEFEIFIAPFTYYVWITLWLSGIIFAIIKLFLMNVYSDKKHFGFDHIWTSFSAFFGDEPTSTPMDTKSSYKTAIVATLLCGTVVWTSYNARLTAELTVSVKKLPFHDMEGLSKTKWR